MLVRVKSESEKFFQNIPFWTLLEFSDTATIHDVKLKIESLIQVPTKEHIIKNSSKSFQDHEKLADIYKSGNTCTCCLMLYVRRNEFVCFLTLYSAGNAQKREIEETINIPPSPVWYVPSCNDSVAEYISSASSSSSDSSSDSSDDKTKKNLPISKKNCGENTQESVNLNENVGTIDQRPKNSNGNIGETNRGSSHCNGTPEKSSNSNGNSGLIMQKLLYSNENTGAIDQRSFNSSENAGAIHQKLHNLNGNSEKPFVSNIEISSIIEIPNLNANAVENNQKSSDSIKENNKMNQRPFDSNQKVVEFYHKSSNSNRIGKKRNTNQEEQTLSVKKRIVTNPTEKLLNNTQSTINSLTALASLYAAPTSQNIVASSIDEVTSREKKPNDTNMPCSVISPEDRKFIAIVKTVNYEEFLKTCFLEFIRNNSVSNLCFDEKVPIAMHSNGDLWIVCKDEYTLSWLIKYNHIACNIEKLQNRIKYRAYSVVLPKFKTQTQSLSDIFRLLENQNMYLSTSQWIVENQHPIDKNEFFDQNMPFICSFEVLYLEIDPESEQYLENKNFQLKYCFWKLIFEKLN